MVRLIKGENDLATLNPVLAKEWHPTENGNLKPEDVTPGSGKEVWWLCPEGHPYRMAVNQRAKRGDGCPYCSGHRALKGVNDLATTHPALAKEWNYEQNGSLTPHDVTAGSRKKVWWLCEKGHAYEQLIVKRSNRGDSCPYCSGHKVLRAFNDLATVNPRLAKEWHPTENGDLTPFDVTAGSGKRVWWLCPLGHAYQATIHDRNNDDTQCPICNAKSQTSFPEQAILFYVKNFILMRSADIKKYSNAPWNWTSIFPPFVWELSLTEPTGITPPLNLNGRKRNTTFAGHIKSPLSE